MHAIRIRLDWKYFSYILLFLYVHTAQSQSRSSSDRFSGRATQISDRNIATDTLERQPLKYSNYSLTDYKVIESNIDTSIGNVHRIEPYYQDLFLVPNLGSENSARASSYLGSAENAVRLDNSIYQRLFQQTEESSLVKVNRSFWQLHYGSGQRVSSSNLIARFYRPFARNIDFNFNYHSFSDNGMSNDSQGNSFGRIDMKLAQKSKHGKRTTYIHYDKPNISEKISTLRDEGVIELNRSDQSFTLGNQIILKDSANAPVKGIWKTKLKYFKKSHTASANQIDSLNIELLPLNFQESLLSYKNELSGLQFENDFSISKFGGDLALSLDLNSYKNTLGDSISTKLLEGLIGMSYSKRILSSVSSTVAGKIGFVDGSGYANIKGGVEALLNYKLRINADFEIGKNIQSLERQQLYVNDTIYQKRDWNNIATNSFFLKMEYLPTKTVLDAGFTSSSNSVLINRFGLYDQITDPINQYWLKLKQELKIGPFYTNHGLLLQSVSNDRIALPKFNYSGRAYFNLWLFKKKMYTQLGADVYFAPSYDTPEFYALTGEFYNSATDTRSSNIFIVNPYFNAKVGPFLFFIKAINSTYLLFPSSYSTINDVRVAQFDQALTTNFDVFEYRFKFGFKWTLLD